MPIYAYRCAACGHSKDVLQKISDPVLTVCPNCGASAFQKQVTAAGFQLKGSGWYVTDFRDGGNSKSPKPTNGSDEAGKSDAAVKPEGGGDKSSTSGGDSAGSGASAASPAPAPAAPSSPAPAASPSAPAAGAK